MKTQFYEFRQNNSGGYFDVNKNVSTLVVIEATSEQDAIDRLQPLIEDQSPSCSCCGDRWSNYNTQIELKKLKTSGIRMSVYVNRHVDDHEERLMDIIKAFNHSVPTLIRHSWGTEFSALVFPQTIEEYCQLMANNYGRSSEYCTIHYINGEICKY